MSLLTQAQLEWLLDYIEEWQWEYEDGHGGRSYSYCGTCGWGHKKEHQVGDGLSHLPGCELVASIEALKAEIAHCFGASDT